MPNDSQPEIITVNSEVLQSQIRDLLPSQNGFGSELQASNVITPIIDLTAAAEGSGLPVSLQQAIAFGSQSAFSVENTTTVLQSAPGFYRIVGVSVTSNKSTDAANTFTMTDGATTKIVWAHEYGAATSTDNVAPTAIQFDIIVWLASGESISASSNKADAIIAGSTRQLADSAGTLVNPSGYPL
jgi:hypothetical protein